MDTVSPSTDQPGTRTSAHVARLEELCRTHHRALLAFLQCRLQSISDAQEVAQEAYVRMLTLERPEGVDDLRAYLFRTASNLAMDRLRQALGELPPKTREAFMAHMIEGLDFRAVANAMRLSERMVRYHVTRALAHCRARVDQLEEG